MTSSEDTTSSLPADLLMAEAQLQNAVIAALASGAARRWSANLRFENLRVLPVALRLARALLAKDCPVLVVWPDAGAAALARRDADDLSAVTMDFNQLKRKESSTPDTRVLLAIGPQPSDYDDFEAVCDGHAGPVGMLNGRLDWQRGPGETTGFCCHLVAGVLAATAGGRRPTQVLSRELAVVSLGSGRISPTVVVRDATRS